MGADIIAMSTLMTTTMPGMKRVVELLKQENMRDKVKVLIGGGPLSQAYSDKIGADGYSGSALDAVRLAKKVVNM